MDNERLEKVLATPWSGRNYSSRIWDNQKKLAQTIKETVMNGVHHGLSVPKMSAEVAKRMEVGKSQAVRLVRTEMNYVQNQANLDSIRSSGLKYYRFCATLDSRTSAQCRAKDGKIFPVDEAHAGVNLPPLHPHCRSTVISSLKADSKAKGWRVARNDGSVVHIPANVTYKEWYKNIIANTVPPGIGVWQTDNSGGIVVTKEIPAGTKGFRTSPIGNPNDVIMHYGKNNQAEFDLYDSKGYVAIQIHCGNHGMPKHHKFGQIGEHAATWEWTNNNGKWIGHPTQNRELTKEERKWVHDYIDTSQIKK